MQCWVSSLRECLAHPCVGHGHERAHSRTLPVLSALPIAASHRECASAHALLPVLLSDASLVAGEICDGETHWRFTDSLESRLFN
jgi:hypothetical protein